MSTRGSLTPRPPARAAGACWPRRLLAAALPAALYGCRAAAPAGPPPAGPDERWTLDQGAVVRGDRTQRTLALVFTGGEHGEGTPAILDQLRQAGVRASFFLTGQYLAVPEQRALVGRMVAEGHYVGPHSHGHLLYCAWEDRARTLVTEAEFREDLAQNLTELRACGALPAGQRVYLIPPYEWFNAEQVRWAEALGVVLFNFSPGSGSNRDWIPEGQAGFVPSARIAADILEFERRAPHGLRGFLLLLHLGSQRQDKMHPHVGPLVAELKRRGYAFVRVDELLAGFRPPAATRASAPAEGHAE